MLSASRKRSRAFTAYNESSGSFAERRHILPEAIPPAGAYARCVSQRTPVRMDDGRDRRGWLQKEEARRRHHAESYEVSIPVQLDPRGVRRVIDEPTHALCRRTLRK